MARPRSETPKSLPVSARLPPEVKAAAERAATDDTRSLSSLMEKVLVDWLRDRGYLPPLTHDPKIVEAGFKAQGDRK